MRAGVLPAEGATSNLLLDEPSVEVAYNGVLRLVGDQSVSELHGAGAAGGVALYGGAGLTVLNGGIFDGNIKGAVLQIGGAGAFAGDLIISNATLLVTNTVGSITAPEARITVCSEGHCASGHALYAALEVSAAIKPEMCGWPPQPRILRGGGA